MAGAVDWSQLLFGDFVDTRELLTELYINQKMSIAAISNFLGVDDQPITKELRRQGIPVRPKGKPGPNNLVAIPGKKQKPNRPKDYDTALIAEGIRLGMSPDNYNGETRLSEIRSCNFYRSCETYTAILHGLTVPCYRCSGEPEYLEQMNIALPIFMEILNASPDKKSNLRDYERKIPTSQSTESKLSDIRKMIQKHNLSDRPMSASDFRYFRRTMG